jgi:DNA polymerase I
MSNQEVCQIDSPAEFADFYDYLRLDKPKGLRFNPANGIVETEDYAVRVPVEYHAKILALLPSKKEEEKDLNDLIWGKDKTSHIVSIEVKENKVLLFREIDGKIQVEEHPHTYWMIGPKKPWTGKTQRLKGNGHFKWVKYYDDAEDYEENRVNAYKWKLFLIQNQKEAAMIKDGYTYFKGMKVDDVSLLSWDLETSGLNPEASDAKIFLISNTFRKQGVITRKLFALDDYGNNERAMLRSWVRWVQEMNPSIFLGYNIVGYDCKYLAGRAKALGIDLELGRDCSPMEIEDYTRRIRKDGSQSYDYQRVNIFGREVVDMFFVALRYDVGRKYSNYKLKNIIKEEKLEVEGRQHYDAGTIKNNWNNPEERAKIKEYAKADADDAIRLFDLMIPSQFYLTSYVPKPFQVVIESASGSQINSVLLRAYLQENHSFPKANEPEEFEGAISLGTPGIFNNVFKLDVTSLYPSIMLQYQVYDKEKDPQGYFQKLVSYFTAERILNKQKSKETGNRYFKDLEQSQKIFINSAYGFLGASGLNFNSPKLAAFVTEKGRSILKFAIKWATGKDYVSNENG